jgi:diguanylate cyclase (GGDEF)-like protein
MQSDQNMRQSILKRMGILPSAIAIGLIAVLVSVPIVWLVAVLLETGYDHDTLILSIVVPMVVAPIVAWYFLKLYFRLETLESQMRHRAMHDSLTGLLQRQSFLDRSRTILETEQNIMRIVMIYFDLDDFKRINDTFGHTCGDKVLTYFGRALSETLLSNEIAGRIGGEEFAVLLVNPDEDRPKYLFEQLRKICGAYRPVLKENMVWQGCSVSAGAVEVHTTNYALHTILLHADRALYRAKKEGKNRIHFAQALR